MTRSHIQTIHSTFEFEIFARARRQAHSKSLISGINLRALAPRGGGHLPVPPAVPPLSGTFALI